MVDLEFFTTSTPISKRHRRGERPEFRRVMEMITFSQARKVCPCLAPRSHNITSPLHLVILRIGWRLSAGQLTVFLVNHPTSWTGRFSGSDHAGEWLNMPSWQHNIQLAWTNQSKPEAATLKQTPQCSWNTSGSYQSRCWIEITLVPLTDQK